MSHSIDEPIVVIRKQSENGLRLIYQPKYYGLQWYCGSCGAEITCAGAGAQCRACTETIE